MQIHPISCQKYIYVVKELPLSLLNSHDFSFFCMRETLHYSMTEIATEMGYFHTQENRCLRFSYLYATLFMEKEGKALFIFISALKPL